MCLENNVPVANTASSTYALLLLVPRTQCTWFNSL